MTTQLDIDLARSESALVALNQKVKMESLQTDMLSSAHANLSLVATSLESMVSEGKAMSPVFAQTAQFSVTSISGGALPSDLISLEGYTGTAEEQTQLSLEGLKDKLVALWEKIKLAVKRAIQAVADFFSKMMGGMKKLEQKVEVMSARADVLQKQVRSTDVKMSITNVDRLMLKGTVSPRIVQDGLKIMYQEVYSSTTEYTGIVGGYQKQIENMLSGGAENSDTPAAIAEANSKMTSQSVRVFKKLTGNTELPGGRAIRIDMYDTTEKKNVPKDMSSKFLSAIKVVDHPGVKNPPSKVEADIPTPRWVGDRLKEVSKFTQAYSKDKREQRIDEFAKMKASTMAKLEKQLEGSSDKAIGEAANRILRSVLDAVQKDYSASIARLDAYVFRYMRAVVAYLEDCLTAYEKATGKKEEATA
jgi:hypothetical protein